MNDINVKILELKIKNLVSARQIVANTLAVLVGGVISIAFMPNGFLKYWLIVIGIFYVGVLICSFMQLNSKIDKLLTWK